MIAARTSLLNALVSTAIIPWIYFIGVENVCVCVCVFVCFWFFVLFLENDTHTQLFIYTTSLCSTVHTRFFVLFFFAVVFFSDYTNKGRSTHFFSFFLFRVVGWEQVATRQQRRSLRSDSGQSNTCVRVSPLGVGHHQSELGGFIIKMRGKRCGTRTGGECQSRTLFF